MNIIEVRKVLGEFWKEFAKHSMDNIWKGL
jgi:hypothetical protein